MIIREKLTKMLTANSGIRAKEALGVLKVSL
jgi:hypothetical protein